MTHSEDEPQNADAGGIEQAPKDDVGAETLARFRFQAELATQFALAMLAGEPIDRIFCELHEDYIVVYSDGRMPCLVSVKHLEPSQARWTLQGLCQDGGVAHLYARWRDTGRSASCLLQTNTGLRGGAENAGQMAEACSRGDPVELETWARLLAPLIAADSEADCAHFLSVLRIEDRLPDRRHVRATNLVEHVPRCLAALGREASFAAQTYDAIVEEIERASRNEMLGGALVAMSDPERLELSRSVRSLLISKTITVERLMAALDRDVAERGPSLAVLADPVPAASHHLTVKLKVGGVGPTGIRNARSLRLNWLGHRDRWTPELPQTADPFDDVASDVLRLAHQAESAVRVAAGEYGAAMESELIQGLEQSGIRVPGDPSGDVRLLLGCAYELTNQCHIYWSDEFEVGEPV